jgi:hypothetical protein
MKEYISEEKIIDMCCGSEHSILLTQSGKVYEYLVNDYKRENSEKYIDFKLKSFMNYGFENGKIVMISCGYYHTLALTESGRVFGWGDNSDGQLGVNIMHSREPIIIELNDLKIQKISCGAAHSLLLSCDGDIYEFGWNGFGEVGNGTEKEQRFPIKLELNNKFIDIASHFNYNISMSQSIDGIYSVWGELEDIYVLSPQSTKHKSFDDILTSNNFINNIKTFEKLIEFKDSFVKNGFYSKNFEEIYELGRGSFAIVFKVKRRENNNCYRSRESEYSAVKKFEFTRFNENEIITEYRNYLIIRKYSKNKYLVKYFKVWFEESVYANRSGISLYIEMELCDKTLRDVINEMDENELFKTEEILTPYGYYIASELFIEILESVDFLHKRNPQIIHRNLRPSNILLKKSINDNHMIKIADFLQVAIHEFAQQSHTMDIGSHKYTAPEVIMGSKYDTKSDIYSLHVILQELFCIELNRYSVLISNTILKFIIK